MSTRRTLTVLLADDHDLVREAAAELLSRAGYKVLEAPGGEAAIDLARNSDEKIDLLLTDVVMPGMSGKDLADRLRAMQPGLRVLYVSGYASDAIVRHGVLEEGLHFLHKPYTFAALQAKIHEVFESD